MQPVKQVPCPRCGGAAVYSPDNPWRPFCGERCKLIDLGKWAAEDYRVPEPAAPDPVKDDESGRGPT